MKIKLHLILIPILMVASLSFASCETSSQSVSDDLNSNSLQNEKKVESANRAMDTESAVDGNENEADGLKAFFQNANDFFVKNVKNGKVDYAGISKNKSQLKDLTTALKEMDISGASENEYKAFWINAYNILTIEGIVNNYPIKQPLDVKGFFDEIKYKVANEEITLNDIENKKLRAKLNDARIHFVLVCGAQSCPPIINEAYMPDNVNDLLEQQTKKAVNADYFVEVDKSNKEVTVSKIMKWYKDDFVSGNQKEIDFLNKYRKEKISADYTLKHKEYNWDLNKQ